jgi:hypothetical protein
MNIDIIDSDDDGPPELVESRESDATFSQEEAPPPRKVPITIVTGTGRRHTLCSQHCGTKHLTILLSRLSRRRENHSTQLHPLITTWQEDRSHPKRLVLSLNTCSPPQPPPPDTHDSNNPSSLQNSVTQPTSKSPSPSPKTGNKSKNGSPSPTAASAVPSRIPASRRSSR